MSNLPPTNKRPKSNRWQDQADPTREPRGLSWRTVLGLAIVLAVLLAINLYFVHDGIHRRVDYAFLRARTGLKRLRPHDLYLPTPDMSSVPTRSPATVTRRPTLAPTQALLEPAVTATSTPRATSTHTAIPTTTVVPNTGTATPTPSATPTPQHEALSTNVLLENDCHEFQGWNNCGPATLAMALRFYGWTEDQYTVAAATKPDKDDKNVSPDEMVAYALSVDGTFALMGYATDIGLLKHLLEAGYPVVVETWFIPEPDDEMGHYRLLTGYDETDQVFITQDSYLGPDQRVSFDELERLWKVFNRVYVVVCPSRRAHELQVLIGHLTAPERMYGDALALALAEIDADPADRYAWFNAGTNYLGLKQYDRAAAAYDQARLLKLPWRLLWYQFGPFEAYLRVGRYQEVIALAEANLRTSENLEESYYYRALARRALGDEEGARNDLEMALRFNPLYERARQALHD